MRQRERLWRWAIGAGAGARNILGNVDISDFPAMGFVGFDVGPTVRIPQAHSPIFTGAQAVFSVAIKPGR